MMMMRRTAVLALGGLPLAACGGTPVSDQGVQTAAQNAVLIANGLQGVVSQLANLVPPIPGLTLPVLATITNGVADIKAVAQAIGTASSQTTAQPLVQKLEGYVNGVVGALAVLPLPPPILLGVQAAAVLLPVIELAVNLALPPGASAPTMTVAQAQQALTQMAALRR